MIIDASVAFKWLVVEPDSAAAEDLFGADLFAPRLMLAEVGNALWKRVRRRELAWTPALSADLERLESLVILIDEREAMARALEISCEIDHPIYDCVYLALAEAREVDLITADARFIGKLKGYGGTARVRVFPS